MADRASANHLYQAISSCFTNPIKFIDKVNPVDGLKEALPYDDLPTCMQSLRAVDSISSLALQFIILTAARSGEVRNAHWSEINLDAKLWTVPDHRMKAGVKHRVPLSEAAIVILKQVQGLSTDWIFFQAQRLAKPSVTLQWPRL